MTASAPATLLCIEDEQELRDELVEELRAMGFAPVGVADSASALAWLHLHTPDLILCDILMPGGDGLSCLAAIRQTLPRLDATPFLFLTALADRDHQLAGRRAGADDYLTKPVDFDILEVAIRSKLALVQRVRSVEPASAPDTATLDLPADPSVEPSDLAPLIHLSPRETQVLRELGLGRRTGEIAAQLGLSEHTVGDYVKAIYLKLHISNRAQAAQEAIRRGLVTV